MTRYRTIGLRRAELAMLNIALAQCADSEPLRGDELNPLEYKRAPEIEPVKPWADERPRKQKRINRKQKERGF